MDKTIIELARQATEEGWDAYRIMAYFIDFQKQKDAKIAEAAGNAEIAALILAQ